MKFLVTGHLGFISSHVVDRLLADPDVQAVVGIDARLTGSQYGCRIVRDDPRYRSFVGPEYHLGTTFDDGLLARLLDVHEISHVLHVAAESHVDRSIASPRVFLEANLMGTFVVLEAVRRTGRPIRTLVVSTDEVYGDRTGLGPSHETERFRPSNPYAASKAAADQLATTYARTYGLDVVITRGGNTIGPRQFEEKLVPKAIRHALAGTRMPIHGDGLQTREWISVQDHAEAILQVALRGRSGEAYNVGGGESSVRTILAVVQDVLRACGQPLDRYALVPGRPGEDRAYGMRIDRIGAELDWRPRASWEDVLDETVAFYRREAP